MGERRAACGRYTMGPAAINNILLNKINEQDKLCDRILWAGLAPVAWAFLFLPVVPAAARVCLPASLVLLALHPVKGVAGRGGAWRVGCEVVGGDWADSFVVCARGARCCVH